MVDLGIVLRFMLRAVNIGAFSSKSGLSADILRHYERLGLLIPLRQANGYRQYQPSQLERAEQIRVLRQLDMPLGEIAALLKSKNPALLEMHEARLLERLVAGRGALLAMRGLLRGKRQHKPLEVQILEQAPSQMLSLRQNVPWHEIQAFSKHCEQAFGALHKTQGIQATGEVLVLQHNLGFVIDHLDLEVQLPVAAPMHGGGLVLAGERPALRLALVAHQLEPQAALPLYRQLHHQLEAAGLAFGTAIWQPQRLGYVLKEA
jgi:DNA-binding transcriptional MerR regulator